MSDPPPPRPPPPAPPPAPDLEVGTTTVDDASPEPRGAFTLSATVANAGGAAAAATTLRYHRSADAAIATTDTQVGTDAMEALAASGSSAESIALTAPSTAATYYYGACVDAVEGESDTTDNCSSPVGLDVAEPAAPDNCSSVVAVQVAASVLGPDLAVTISGIDIRENDDATSVFVTVSNVGTVTSANSKLTLYGLADATGSPDHFWEDPRQEGVSPLEPGAERCYWWGFHRPPHRPACYYAAVGVVPNETSIDNNESAVAAVPLECSECSLSSGSAFVGTNECIDH